MTNEKKCDKYEAYFVFRDEEAFYEHIENCEDCRKEHEKYSKVSNLVKEVAPQYLKKMEKAKINNVKKLACCFIAFVGLTSFSGYKIYDEYSFQVSSVENSYIEDIGLPIDDYGFLEI